MKRFSPRSLFGQTLLVLLLGLAVSHGIGAWIYSSDRSQAVRAIGGLATALRIANAARLVEDAPAEWRPRLIGGLGDPSFRISLLTAPPDLPDAEEQDPAARAVAGFVARQLPDGRSRQVLVTLAGVEPHTGRGMHMGMGMMMGRWRSLQAAVELSDGAWLGFATAVPESAPEMPLSFVVSLASMAVVVLAASIWAVRRVTTPLAGLALAAERLGRDVATEPLPERGSEEVRQASRAFNRMQRRLRRLVDNRTRMLAALSHDLRTPLTLLRLRTEGLAEGEERERMLATIADMEAMIAATLAFARDEAAAEPRRPVDVAALLASIVDDLADSGLPAAMAPAGAITLDCQPVGLKRVLGNLLDNAIKYGGTARAAITRDGGMVEITVDDDGPGIPEADMERVFQPFTRLDESRSRDTGGSGLGLAIAQSIVQSHGGEIALENRPEGGLRARVTLPAG